MIPLSHAQPGQALKIHLTDKLSSCYVNNTNHNWYITWPEAGLSGTSPFTLERGLDGNSNPLQAVIGCPLTKARQINGNLRVNTLVC